MSAMAIALQKLQDIWVTGPACRPIALPESLDGVPQFLRWTVHVLFNLWQGFMVLALSVAVGSFAICAFCISTTTAAIFRSVRQKVGLRIQEKDGK